MKNKILLLSIFLILLASNTYAATLGYTTAGASASDATSYLCGSKFSSTGSNVTSKITASLANGVTPGNNNYNVAIYTYSSSFSLVGNATYQNITTNIKSWYDFTTTINFSNNEIWLYAWGYYISGNQSNVYYDSGDANQGNISYETSYGNPSLNFPSSFSMGKQSTKKFSIYATYEPASTYSRNSTTTINNGRININHGRLNIR